MMGQDLILIFEAEEVTYNLALRCRWRPGLLTIHNMNPLKVAN